MMCLHLLLDLLSQKQTVYTQNQSNVIQRHKRKDAARSRHYTLRGLEHCTGAT